MPGISPINPTRAADTPRGLGSDKNWALNWAPIFWVLLEMPVTMMADATDNSKDGIWATSPSPIVSNV